MKANLLSLEDLIESRDPSFKFEICMDPSEEYFVPPATCDPRDSDNAPNQLRSQFIESRIAKTPPRSIVYLENCYVLPNAAIVTSAGNIIAESCFPYVHPWIAQSFQPWICEKDGTYVVNVDDAEQIDTPTIYFREHGEMGFFHWMHSVLPRLDILKRCKFAMKFQILCQAKAVFQTEGLAMAGASRFFRLSPRVNQPQFFRHLIFPSALVKDGDFWQRPLSVNRFYEDLPTTASSFAGRRIYITRQDALVRRLKNEQALLDELKNLGFQSLQLAGMRLQEQISIFRQSEVVVACHGAGLSHVVSMTSKARILEIVHPRRFWPTYRAIAARKRVPYGFVLGDDQESSVSGSSFDFDVDVHKTLSVLKALGAS